MRSQEQSRNLSYLACRHGLPSSHQKGGFTLMELLVYMAIVGVVVVIAGQAFSNATKFRIRTDNMVRATQEAENVAMLFKEDVFQIGTKSSKETGFADAGAEFGDKFSGVNSNVYMDPANSDEAKRDSSSFRIETTDNFSDLTFRRLRYGENGAFQAVEQIHWYVDVSDKSNKILKRSCKITQLAPGVAIAADDPCKAGDGEPDPIEMATGVTKFKVEAAIPGAMVDEVQIFPPDNLTAFRLVPRTGDGEYAPFKSANTTTGSEQNGGNSITLSNFFSNYDNSSATYLGSAERKINQAYAIKNETTSDMWNVACASYGKVTLMPDMVYEISFSLADRGLRFVPGTDHMSVGFRTAGSGDIPMFNGRRLVDDFLFFPPMDTSGRGAGKRTMRFTVPEKVENVCMAFTFACFSPLASNSKLTIKNLKLTQVASSSYTFEEDYNPENYKKEKKNIKALKLKLQVSRGAKKGGKGETGDVDLIAPMPSNGPRD